MESVKTVFGVLPLGEESHLEVRRQQCCVDLEAARLSGRTDWEHSFRLRLRWLDGKIARRKYLENKRGP